MITAIELPNELKHEFVGLVFNLLDSVVVLPGEFEADSESELPYHNNHHIDGLLEHETLSLEVRCFRVWARNDEALGKLLGSLGNLVKSFGKGLNIFPLERGKKSGEQFLADLPDYAFFMTTGFDEGGEGARFF